MISLGRNSMFLFVCVCVFSFVVFLQSFSHNNYIKWVKCLEWRLLKIVIFRINISIVESGIGYKELSHI